MKDRRRFCLDIVKFRSRVWHWCKRVSMDDDFVW